MPPLIPLTAGYALLPCRFHHPTRDPAPSALAIGSTPSLRRRSSERYIRPHTRKCLYRPLITLEIVNNPLSSGLHLTHYVVQQSHGAPQLVAPLRSENVCRQNQAKFLVSPGAIATWSAGSPPRNSKARPQVMGGSMISYQIRRRDDARTVVTCRFGTRVSRAHLDRARQSELPGAPQSGHPLTPPRPLCRIRCLGRPRSQHCYTHARTDGSCAYAKTASRRSSNDARVVCSQAAMGGNSLSTSSEPTHQTETSGEERERSRDRCCRQITELKRRTCTAECYRAK